MTKKDLLQEIRELAVKTGGWRVALNLLNLADYVIGYYYNEETKLYEVYVNDERGSHSIFLKTANEMEALEKLLTIVSYHAEVYRRVSKKNTGRE